MTKRTLSSILLGLVSTVALACGDAGGAPFDEDLSPGEVLAGDPVGDDGDAEPGAEPGSDESVADPEGETEDDDADPIVEIEPPIIVLNPACGDGNLDASERCDDGNGKNGDGCSASCELEVEGPIAIDIAIDDLRSTEAPAEGSCSDVIDLVFGTKRIAGEGSCLLEGTSNTLSYVLDLDLEPSGQAEGEIEIILNGAPHVLEAAGSLVNGVFTVHFDGVTLVNRSIRVVWIGDAKAVFN